MRFCEKWRDVILFYEHKFVFFHITSQELHEILEALGIRYTFLGKKKKSCEIKPKRNRHVS